MVKANETWAMTQVMKKSSACVTPQLLLIKSVEEMCQRAKKEHNN